MPESARPQPNRPDNPTYAVEALRQLSQPTEAAVELQPRRQLHAPGNLRLKNDAAAVLGLVRAGQTPWPALLRVQG